jgi:hypothetical protein
MVLTGSPLHIRNSDVSRCFACCLLLASAVLSTAAVAQPAETAAWAQTGDACWTDLLTRPEVFPIQKVVVGCDVVDCCPGCPNASSLDWRVQVSGNAIEAVHLSFKNLSAAAIESLALTGATLTAGGIRVPGGTGVIKALPMKVGNLVPVASLRLALDNSWTPVPAPANRIDVLIEQLLGEVVVNEFALQFTVEACPAVAAPPSDRIELRNNADNDSAVIVWSARRGPASSATCVSYGNARATGTANLGSLIPKDEQTCPSSNAAVFSDDNAMFFAPSVTTWTAGMDDELPVDLEKRVAVPVKVFVTDSMAGSVPQLAVDTANAIYNENNTGIVFEAAIDSDLSTEEADAIGSRNCSRDEEEWKKLETLDLYGKDHLYVYYVPLGFTAVNCDKHRNAIFVGTTSGISTLAHELGHALSLKHPPASSTLTSLNIMRPTPFTNHVSEGQAFRMNAQCTSSLNTMVKDGDYVRPGAWPRVRCNDGASGIITCPEFPRGSPPSSPVQVMTCPSINHDVLPK